jgi:hypothetical protein
LRLSGGLYWLEFDGTDDILSAGDKLDLGTRSYWGVVGAKYATTGDGAIYAKSVSSAAGRYTNGRESSVGGLYSFYQHAANVFAVGADTSTAVRVLTTRLDRVAGTISMKANRSTAIGSNTFTPDTGSSRDITAALTMGDIAGGGLPFSGRIYGLIVKQSASLSEAEIYDAERFIALKAGLSL